MGSNIGNGVSLRGLTQDAFNYVFLAASGIAAGDEGKSVTLNGTTNTVALAGDHDFVIGTIETFEDRTAEGIKVVTVKTEGGMSFLVNPDATASSPDETPAVGDFLEGATTTTGTLKGYVQKVQSTNRSKFQVVELYTGTDGKAYAVAISV